MKKKKSRKGRWKQANKQAICKMFRRKMDASHSCLLLQYLWLCESREITVRMTEGG